MTLAIGAANAEGAVLVTDSLVQHRTAHGVRAMLCVSPRFTPLAGGVAIVSGNTDGSWAMPALGGRFDAAVSRALVALQAGLAPGGWAFSNGSTQPSCGEILAAGVVGGAVRLWRGGVTEPGAELGYDALTPPGGVWPGTGALVAAGAARHALAGFTDELPDDLGSLREVVLGLARQVVSDRYRQDGMATLDDYLDHSQVPWFAGPFHVATVTTQGMQLRRAE